MELKIEGLTKRYQGRPVVDHLTLSLGRGVTGLLGENGAGKTTLMRMVCGILSPDEGRVSYEGIPVSEEAYRDVLGYLPQDFGYYPEFSGMDFLLYFSALKGLSKGAARVRARELLEVVGLTEAGEKQIRTYSGGMKQRLGIAQALINRPEVVILDEPTQGLDPKERVRFRDLIRELGTRSVVLLSTHIVSDIEAAAGRLLIMREGRLCYDGPWTGERGELEDFYLRMMEKEEKG